MNLIIILSVIITSLTPKVIRCPILYHHSFHTLNDCFKEHNIKLIPKSKTKDKDLSTSTKDQIPAVEKSGVYLAKCLSDDCNTVYTYRANGRTIKNSDERSSAIAEHVFRMRKQPKKIEHFGIVTYRITQTKWHK